MRLTGLILISFLHFGCGSLFSSKLGVDCPGPSTSSVDEPSTKTSIMFKDIDIALAGKPYKGREESEKDSVYKFGYDACFFNIREGSVPEEQKLLFGVADGVGDDICGGRYAHRLMCGVKLSTYDGLENMIRDTDYQVFKDREREKVCGGATTICLATIDQSGLLNCANLGDSIVKVFRNNDVVFETKTQEHDFNDPYILYMPSSDQSQNNYDLIQYNKFELKVGDIVIMATDGVWDNLWSCDIINIIKKLGICASAQELVTNIAEKAYQVSQDQNTITPFADKAMNLEDEDKRWDYEDAKGGKEDDISVIVAIIK